MNKINFRTISSVLSDKQLKNLMGGSGMLDFCGYWYDSNTAYYSPYDQCFQNDTYCRTVYGDLSRCIPYVNLNTCGCSM